MEIRLATGLIGEPGEVILPPVKPPEAVPEMAHARGVNRIDEDPVSLSLLDSRIQIRIRRTTAKRIDAIGDHQNLAADRALRPAFDQVHDGQVRAGICPDGAERQPKGLSRRSVVRGQVLNNVHGPISHVPDTNCRGSGLGVDESTKIIQL